MSDDLVVADVHGYRTWEARIDANGLGLGSLFAGPKTVWASKNSGDAACVNPESSFMNALFGRPASSQHSSPAADCECGWWAYNEPEPEENYLLSVASGVGFGVSGVVRASGVVAVHETGFRAQKLEILALAPLRSPLSSAWCPCGCGMPVRHSMSADRSTIAVIAERYSAQAFVSFDSMIIKFPPAQRNEKSHRTLLDDKSTLRGVVQSVSQSPYSYKPPWMQSYPPQYPPPWTYPLSNPYSAPVPFTGKNQWEQLISWAPKTSPWAVFNVSESDDPS
jgi:hypothetical protein